ncbi:uroporphyrinogen-III synthase [Candidatus Trichorickettsia mobilis]|uniref:uroporphyrinogen-III synthase n=1 Tax=Candidatus Trichorickettsia mobilis TaxID=1346319 RepID=UPI002931ECD8|nr:uroporphyrinogen-III synthase [Candidatus Trichorickettsia mobilis]
MKQLEPYNFNCISCPLITYKNLPIDYVAIFDHYSNIIITSKHAAKLIYSALNNLSANYSKDMELWVVGHTSAVILKSMPFIKIQYIANDVRDLINNLPKTIYNKAVYLSANEITSSLPTAITRQVIYEVSYKETLKTQDFNELIAGIDYILLYSQNCAKTLIKLLAKYNLINTLKNTIVITISAKVANIVNIYFSNVVYVDQAEHQQMINLLINYDKN